MPDEFDVVPFQVDHVLSRQHGGPTRLDNLAWSCSVCNARKGTNLSAVDPKSREVVRLFDPRSQSWDEHFRIAAGRVFGKTSAGRATARLLRMNDPVTVALRIAILAASE